MYPDPKERKITQYEAEPEHLKSSRPATKNISMNPTRPDAQDRLGFG